ncbi:tetratricopeptide repeat protein [Streptomyces sp. NPDC057580]|uniref:tetratricopeptide repeat protein n=1 Tax=Streptomyces sp. NPDC057580 TaxID=3346173 RepID=UPI00369ADA8E
MGGKNKPKNKTKKAGAKGAKRSAQPGSAGRVGLLPGRVPGQRVDFRESTLSGPTQGSGTQNNTFVQQYAPVPTALDALPPLPEGFTGRDDDIAFLLNVVDPDRAAGQSAVAVLSGWGGVGKTTLAHAAGHAAQERGWFTGVLLVDLRGYDPHPAQAEDALEALLRSLGVRPEHLPPPGAEREVLYRSQLNARERAGERLLVVADNASAAGQVRPLLPPGDHGMLVTSRHSLPGLGRMRTVNRLQPDDAVALLKGALQGNDPDDQRVDQELAAAEQLALACGYLPLALQITAALLAGDPGQPLAERADSLVHAEGILDGLNDGERSLRATFDQSFDRLPPQEQDLFRLLSLNAGPDISTPAAAVLADLPQAAAERLLGQLAASHLIERGTIRGRWQMHDLLRAYSREQADAFMARGRVPRRRYEQARARLTGHYVQLAEAADTHLQLPGTVVASQFAGRAQALAWFDAERENLIATAHTEATTETAVSLGFSLGRYLEWRRRLQDLVMVRSLALDACHAMGDTRNVAGAWNNLGGALQELRRYEEALNAHQTARNLFQQTGDTHGEATAWNNLGLVLQELRRFEEALNAHQTARNLFQQTGNTNGKASAWNNLGLALKELRRYEEALNAHQTARNLFQQTGDTHSEATAWNNLGTAYRGLERFEEAVAAGQRAAEMLAAAEDWFHTGQAWGELATTLTAAHADPQQVTDAWNHSATAYTQAGAEEEATRSTAASNRSSGVMTSARLPSVSRPSN